VSIGERLFAALYDPLTKSWEEKHGAELKRPLLAHARGRTLEIGVGTGLSLRHYPRVEELIAIEPSESMRRRAERRAAGLGHHVTFISAAAERLPFTDRSFDTVVALLVLCTIGDPAAALREIHRVLRPEGRFLFFEHVRSDDLRRARWQDRLARPWRAVAGGCHPNRATLDAIKGGGFDIETLERGELPGQVALVRPYARGIAVRR
jgi:ubiquinone/menaquinone biosynthesis C-methylase UbiE